MKMILSNGIKKSDTIPNNYLFIHSQYIMKHYYDTVLEAINDLKKRGFTFDFTMNKDKLYCSEKQCNFNPDEFEIVEFYRFEGMSDPEDSAIVYAIKSEKNNIRGFLVNAFGSYSDTVASQLLSKIKIAKESYF